jgi:hypothetical protein
MSKQAHRRALDGESVYWGVFFTITIELMSTRNFSAEERSKRAERMRAMNIARTKHGHCRRENPSSEYRVWRNMLERCENKTHKNFERYGGRGIRVCARWHIFENFLSDMGARPSSVHSIKRNDNNGNYEPLNCRWGTWRDQARNRSSTRERSSRRSSRARMITVDQETLPVVEWAERAGVSPHIVYSRLNRGWTPTNALSTSKVRNRPNDLSGLQVGSLFIVERVANDRFGKSAWKCVCSCGVVVVANGSKLSHGSPRSCFQCSRARKNSRSETTG